MTEQKTSDAQVAAKPRVFVVQEMFQHDITGAMRYGEVVPLLPSNAQVAFSPYPIIRSLRHKLVKMRPDDYLLLTGDPVLIGLCCSIAAMYNGGVYRVLKWDKRERLYIPITLDITEKGERDADV